MTQARLMSEGANSNGSRQDEERHRGSVQTLFRWFDTGKENRQFRMGLRVASFVGLAVLAATLVDIRQVQGHIAAVSWASLTAMIVLHLIIISLASWRFAVVARASGAMIGSMDATRLTFTSTLANMLLPTSLMGDVGRVWLVRRFGLTLRSAMRVGIFDRVIGLISLGIVVLMGALAEPGLISFWALASMCALLFVAAMVTYPRDGSTQIPHDAASPSASGQPVLISLLLSVAAHLVSIAIVWSFFAEQDVQVPLAQLLALFPPVLLAASIPVSFGGWGTRELAAVAAFSMIGVPASTAIAMAFLFGLTQVAASALGTATLSFFGRSIASEHE